MESFASNEYWVERGDQDSSFKLQLVFYFFEKYPYLIKNKGSYADIGCGNGSFILAFADYLRNIGRKYVIYGYDTSAYAIELAKKKIGHEDNVKFYVGSCSKLSKGMDVVFCMDVIEHLEEPYKFLRSLKEKTIYLILHLPLEQSICHLLLKKPSTSFIKLGHLHFFSWETANILINHSPFKMVDYRFTSPAISLRILSKDIKKFHHLFRYLLYKIHPFLAAILFGGSVLVLLKNNDL